MYEHVKQASKYSFKEYRRPFANETIQTEQAVISSDSRFDLSWDW